MQIKDLQDGMKKANIQAKITEKNEVREVKSRFKDETYRICDVIIADSTGTIKLTLWNEQIDMVNVGDMVTIANGYVTSFKGELQVNVGKFGKITAI